MDVYGLINMIDPRVNDLLYARSWFKAAAGLTDTNLFQHIANIEYSCKSGQKICKFIPA